jgi:sRNA-binding carbon storage regulator CsrA
MFITLKKKAEALTFCLAGDCQRVTIGVAAIEGDQVMLGVDAAPGVSLEKEGVVSCIDHAETSKKVVTGIGTRRHVS